jgi:hypothetical protein
MKSISNVKKRFFLIPPDKKERMYYKISRALRMSYVSPQGTDIILPQTSIHSTECSKLNIILILQK